MTTKAGGDTWVGWGGAFLDEAGSRIAVGIRGQERLRGEALLPKVKLAVRALPSGEEQVKPGTSRGPGRLSENHGACGPRFPQLSDPIFREVQALLRSRAEGRQTAASEPARPQTLLLPLLPRR